MNWNIVFFNLVAIIFAVFAGVMAIMGISGWGWFMAGALITGCYQVSKTEKNKTENEQKNS